MTDWWTITRTKNDKRNIVVKPDGTGCLFTIFRLDEDIYRYSVFYMDRGKTIFSDTYRSAAKAEEAAREYAEELRSLNLNV